MKQQPSPHRLGEFMEGKGFYIALFLCVAAIGISGYYLFSGLFPQQEGGGGETIAAVNGEELGEWPVSGLPSQEVPQVQETPDRVEVMEPTPETPEPMGETTFQTEPTDEPESSEGEHDVPAAETAYAWPLQGEVERDFSLEVFAYDATMGDWRTHEGLDIAAELGSPVCACAKGVVSQVDTSDMMGVSVTVDHGNGIQSVYANLEEGVSVQVGQDVQAGTPLGTVGATAIAESASPSHLHFAMAEYGVNIDPRQYLP